MDIPDNVTGNWISDEPVKQLDKLDCPDLMQRVRARAPARLLVGRAGTAYRTNTQLELREDHAAARDAVRAELDLKTALGYDSVSDWGLFEADTEARDKDDYLLPWSRSVLFRTIAPWNLQRCSKGSDLQIVIGDGLSVAGVAAQLPALLPLLKEGPESRSWSVGQTFVIRHCRVGILNEIGELLDPAVVVLLIGERPGLAPAESLSAYMAFRPREHHSDADRNLISNIHARGVSTSEAAIRILNLAARMMVAKVSGYTLREDPAALPKTWQPKFAGSLSNVAESIERRGWFPTKQPFAPHLFSQVAVSLVANCAIYADFTGLSGY